MRLLRSGRPTASDLESLQAEVAALTERVDALEAVEEPRPTVELVEWSRVPVAEPLDVNELWDAVSARYAYGFDDDEAWRCNGYL